MFGNYENIQVALIIKKTRVASINYSYRRGSVLFFFLRSLVGVSNK